MAKHIKSGFLFEREVFGFSDESTIFSLREPYENAVKRVLLTPLRTKTESGELEEYNPFNPSKRWGKSGDILRAVKKHLTKRFKGKRISSPGLYLAGGTTLDTQWKVDAFIKWDDVIVTLDASTKLKSRDPIDLAWGVPLLETADVVLLPEDIKTKKSLKNFGKRVAAILNQRGREKRLKDYYGRLTPKEIKELHRPYTQL